MNEPNKSQLGQLYPVAFLDALSNQAINLAAAIIRERLPEIAPLLDEGMMLKLYVEDMKTRGLHPHQVAELVEMVPSLLCNIACLGGTFTDGEAEYQQSPVGE